MLQPDAGDIGYGDHSIWADLAAYQQNITYLGHKLGYNSNLTIWEHAHLDWDLSADPARLVQILHEFKLWAIKDRVCAQLSAGQKRRVSLLRLGLAATSLWLLDEPLVTLDQEGVTVLMRRIQQHVAQGGQVIYTSHQPLPAHQMAHHEYELCKR